MANDKGQEYTDSVISELERKIQKEYKQANDEVQQKVDDYFARFAKKDQKKQAQLKAGYITQEEYNEWRYGQICVGERWKELKQNIAQDYVNTNQIARAMIEDRQADVYAMNHNFATYQVEHDSLMDTSYTLYNRRTVQNLIKDDPRLLPFPKTDSPTAKKLRDRMDLIWNRQKINSAITQGVLQGESIPQISKRLEKVTNMNHTAAVRNARTMMTSCENKGRQDAYDKLRDKGIDLAEKWIATLDGRTRHSHRHLHGTYKDPKTGLYENGLEYPADPFGEPEEIYNCRCCEIAEVLGFKIDTPTTSPKLGDMSFDEWLNAKGNKESLWWYKDRTASVVEKNMFGLEYGKKFSVNGVDVLLTKKEKFNFEGGREGDIYQTRSADVYKVGDIKIYYPSDTNISTQNLRPEELISELTKIDDNFRSLMQKQIVVVDYQNPQDAHWAKAYKMKNFRSYATGGRQITFYAWTDHDMDYVGKTLRHEAGHWIDRKNSDGGVNSYKYFSDGAEWKKAQKLDSKYLVEDCFRQKEESRWVSNYARRSKAIHEDFADSCQLYSLNKESFEVEYPNRAKILERLIDHGNNKNQ